MEQFNILLAFIDNWIKTNGNREITAAVLNPVLKAIADWARLQMGNLENLNTSDKSNLVAAINEVNQALSTVGGNAPTVHNGEADPNVTPPLTYQMGDFYLQEDLENNPMFLFIYDGNSWVNLTTFFQDNQPTPNGFVTLNPIIENGNERTFQAGETYNLGGELRTLATDYVTTIATESEGVSRFDVVYALANGTYGKAVGVSGEVAQIPDIPSGSLMRSIFAVNGSAINEQPPISSDNFVTKNSFGFISVTMSGLQPLVVGGTYVAQPGVTFISGFASPSAATTFYGQPIKIYNNTGGLLDLRHGQGLVQMDFVSGDDYKMADQETATFWLQKDSNKLRLQSSSVRGGGASIDQDNIFKRHTFTLADLGVSSFDEVTEAMLLAAVQNSEIPVSEIELYLFNVVEGNEPVEYNFDVTADWADWGVTDEASFLVFFENQGATDILISDFSLNGGRLSVNIDVYINSLELRFNVTEIGAINLETLQSLFITNNQLTSIDNVVFPDGLQTLDVGGNQLTSLTDVVFPDGLQYLSVSYNQLTSLTDVVFPVGLQTLYVTGTQLTSLTDVVFPVGLQTLDFRYNQLTSLTDVVFPDGLQTLDFRYNQLTSLTINNFLSARIAEGVTGRFYYFDGTGNEPADPSLVSALIALGNTVQTN